jgi:rhamnose transport system permease protein
MGSLKGTRKKSGGFRLDRFRELGILFTGVLIFVIVCLINPKFIGFENLRSIMLYIPLIVVVSMGEMIVIVTRNIDLSVGSILGFSGIAVGMIFVRNINFPISVAFILGTLIGVALGLINGLLITKLRLPAIIVTLGSLNLYRGAVFILSGGRQVDPNNIPQGLIALSQTSPIGIPWIVLFALAIALLFGLFLKFSHVGREMYAIGSNPQAAVLRGINVSGVLLLVFVLSGATAGFAGIMYASRFGYVNPGMTGVGFEFTVIGATIIGGASVAGGTGTVLGTVIGCTLLGIVNTALAVLGISAFWQQATYGMIIVIALLIDRTVQTQVMKAVRGGNRGAEHAA